MLEDGQEFRCVTVDVSPTGIAIEGRRSGSRGQLVIAYLQDLGRIEGPIVRELRSRRGFAIEIHAPEPKIERVANRIALLVRRTMEGRPQSRSYDPVVSNHEQVIIRIASGQEYPAELIDVSLEGAALRAEIALPIGTQITIGEKRAYVVRFFPGGLEVSF